jgi:O-antigen ligase
MEHARHRLTFPSAGGWALAAGFCIPLSLAAANAAMALFIATWGLSLAFSRERPAFTRTPMDAPVLFMLLTFVASALAGLDPAGSFQRFPSQFRFVIFYALIMAAGGAHAVRALSGYLAGAVAAAAYGLGQFALWRWIYPDPYALGFPSWFLRLPAALQRYTALHGDPAPEAIHRIHGAMHPLTYAELLMPAFLFMSASFMWQKGRSRWRGAGGAALTGAALWLSQSRGPWMGTLAGLVLLSLMHRRRWTCLVLLGGLVAVTAVLPVTHARVSSLASFKSDPSARIRLDLWRSGLFLLKEHRWLGVGPGQVARARDVHKGDPSLPPCPERFAGDLHNLYLQHGVTKGITGLGVLLWLLLTPFLLILKRLRSRATPWELGALAAFYGGFLLLNITERAFDDAEVNILYWVLTAAAFVWMRSPSKETV